MKFEKERQERMKEYTENRIRAYEERAEAIRARLSEELEILTKHELTLNRKEERGEDPGITQERLEKKREVVGELEEELKAMEAMAGIMRSSIQDILAFSPVQDALDDLPSKFKPADGEWQIPNCRFKTVQDILTPPEARILPNYKRKPSYNEYQRLPIDACPVDPALIPDWFIEEFQLGKMDDLSEFEKLRAKAEVTPEVLEVFKHTEPLEVYKRKSHRVLVLQGYSTEHDGKVLITSYTGRKKREEDRKTIQLFGSAYEAHRRMIHADQGYEAEQEKLDGIKGRVQGILGDTKGLKKDDPRKEKVTGRIQSELEILGKVLNYHKVEAADILSEVSDLKDSLGRHNPGAACRRIVQVIDLFEQRLPEIYHKSRYVNDDKKMLNKAIHQGAGALEEARVASLDLCEALENGNDGAELVRRLSLMPELDGLVIRPFNEYAGKFLEKRGEMQAALLDGNKRAFRDAAINAYVTCKTFEVQHERERILRDIAESPMQVTVESLLERAMKLSGIVTSKDTFVDVRTGQNEPYREMAAKIAGLVRGLEAYRKRKLTEPEKLAMYERLKAYIEEIDFTEILEKL